MSAETSCLIQLQWQGGSDFRVDFQDAKPGPNPSRILAAAIAQCLAESFAFGARRAKLPLSALFAEARALFKPNARGGLRIESMDVALRPSLARPEPRFDEIVSGFEDF